MKLVGLGGIKSPIRPKDARKTFVSDYIEESIIVDNSIIAHEKFALVEFFACCKWTRCQY